MSNAVPAVQAVNPQTETQTTSPAPKTQQTSGHPVSPQDSVTISSHAHQILANNGKPAAGG